MINQDFEHYAIIKNMIGQVAATWEHAFYEEINKRHLVEPSQIKFLDYGCGDGRYFTYLIQKGFSPDKIYGIEVSKKRIERCKDLGWKNAGFINLKEQLPFENDFFDVVNFVEVIEHIPYNQVGFYLNEIKRVMKPNAFLILTTPNYPIKRIYDFTDAVFCRKWARLKDDPTHVSKYRKSKIQKTLTPFFSKIDFSVYKEGFLYKKFKSSIFMHKILAIASNP